MATVNEEFEAAIKKVLPEGVNLKKDANGVYENHLTIAASMGWDMATKRAAEKVAKLEDEFKNVTEVSSNQRYAIIYTVQLAIKRILGD